MSSMKGSRLDLHADVVKLKEVIKGCSVNRAMTANKKQQMMTDDQGPNHKGVTAHAMKRKYMLV